MTLASEAQVNTTTLNGSMILPSGKVSTPAAPSLFPRTLAVTSIGRGNAWTTTAHVVIAVETPEVEEKVPDIIILGPSIPVVLIFVLVVAGIAWWNYKFNSEELNRLAIIASRQTFEGNVHCQPLMNGIDSKPGKKSRQSINLTTHELNCDRYYCFI